MLVHNGNVVTRNDDWLQHVVHLPPYTIRIRTTNGEPFKIRYPYNQTAIQVKVPFTDDVYDITYVSDDWHNFFGWSFSPDKDMNTVKEVIAFNSTGITNMENLFHQQTNLVKTVSFDTTAVTTLYQMYYDCHSLKEAPHYDMSAATTLEGMFRDCWELETAADIYAPLATTASYIYSRAGTRVQDRRGETVFGSMNLPSCTSLNHAFYTTGAVDHIGPIYAPNVTDIEGMFRHSFNLTVAPEITTSNVTNMSATFTACSALVEVPEYDLGKVQNMFETFSGCSSIEELPVFDTHSVTNFQDVCRVCTSLKKVPLWDTSSCTKMDHAFHACSNVESGAYALYLQASSQETVPSHYCTFYGCGENTTTGAAELAAIPPGWKED